MSNSAPFAFECPRCGHERLQPGYASDELQQLLDSGADVEAYCSSCDQSWAISVEERVDLARALTAPRPARPGGSRSD